MSKPARRAFMIAIAALGLAPGCGETSPEEADEPAPPALTLSFPQITVGPGQEDTQCVVLRLGNTTPLRVGGIHNTLGTGSHHLIVYRVDDTEERTTPFKCQPFTDTLDATKGSTLMVTQKKDDLLTLPEGVAYSLPANQMMRLEMHFINPSASERTISATTTVIPIADRDFRNEADFLFIGNPDIRIAPKSRATLGPTFFELPSEFASVNFFAITGHEHQFGTNVQVATATRKGEPGTMVYDVPGWSWNEPKTEVFPTPFTIPAGGGFNFTCSWNNTSDKTVEFGESANDEMCFFWAYYYPSQGARVCMHTSQAGGADGLDICCPGHPLCSVVNDELKKRRE